MREENNRSSQKSSFKRFMKKRWVFPAIYIASAAIILTAVLWYQNGNTATDKYGYKSSDLSGKKYNQPAVEVNKALENFKMPVANADSAVIKMKFYDFNAPAAERVAATVYYNNTYQPNTGIDIAMKDDASFDVVASLSGTVTSVDESDPVLGNAIEIEHENGVVTKYQSVKDIKVKVGDKVKQSQVIARAGQSLLNEKAGTHVHFEIRKDSMAVDPSTFLNKPVTALTSADASKKVPASKVEQQKVEDDNEKDGAAKPESKS